MDEWMTTEEAARELKLAESTVRRLCKEETLHSRHVRRDWLIDPAAVEAYKTAYRKRGVKPPEVRQREAVSEVTGEIIEKELEATRCGATCEFRRNWEAMRAYQCQLVEGHGGRHHVEVVIGTLEWIG